MTKVTKHEESRGEVFSNKTPTQICLELGDEDNSYVAKERFLFGYSMFELASKKSFLDVVYLQLMGELPSQSQSSLLNHAILLICNLGPRHESSRAAMNCGIGRTDLNHAIPISLCTLSGKKDGSQAVFDSIKFIQTSQNKGIKSVVNELLEDCVDPDSPHFQIAPGLGLNFGGVDVFANESLESVLHYARHDGPIFWIRDLSKELNPFGFGILLHGFFAAVCVELGLGPKHGLALFQIAVAPSLAAYAIEKFAKPLTEMPFLSEDDYEILP